MKYNVFISYRRDGGASTAYTIAEALRRRHLKVFYDVEEMRAGDFNEQLYDVIEEADVFVPVLSKNSLDRCIGNPKDWVRKEIEHALKSNKTIIPVMLHEFEFPDNLPESMVDISKMHGVIPNMDYTFETTMDHLVKLIKDSCGKDIAMEDELQVRMQSYRSFASCGLEDTVFKIKKAAEGIQASVNFEPTRLRNEVPMFAGIYYLFTPAVDISYNQKIVFDACSEDESIERIWLELKPEGKKWMHESFEFELTKEYQTFSVDIKDFSNMATAENFEEITFVFKPTSFRDENNLTGKIKISNIQIKA